jgi:hypothetical protein
VEMPLRDAVCVHGQCSSNSGVLHFSSLFFLFLFTFAYLNPSIGTSHFSSMLSTGEQAGFEVSPIRSSFVGFLINARRQSSDLMVANSVCLSNPWVED